MRKILTTILCDYDDDDDDNTRWFKYDRDKLWLVYTQIVPVIFEPPCSNKLILMY
jgi:hypothetical protein